MAPSELIVHGLRDIDSSDSALALPDQLSPSGMDISDLPIVTRLARRLYSDCYFAIRGAPDRFRALVISLEFMIKELECLQNVIQAIHNGVSSSISLLGRFLSEDERRDLERCITSCHGTLQEYDKVTLAYRQILNRDGFEVWRKIEFAPQQRDNEDLQSNIQVHTSNLKSFINSIQNRDLKPIDASLKAALDRDQHEVTYSPLVHSDIMLRAAVRRAIRAAESGAPMQDPTSSLVRESPVLEMEGTYAPLRGFPPLLSWAAIFPELAGTWYGCWQIDHDVWPLESWLIRRSFTPQNPDFLCPWIACDFESRNIIGLLQHALDVGVHYSFDLPCAQHGLESLCKSLVMGPSEAILERLKSAGAETWVTRTPLIARKGSVYSIPNFTFATAQSNVYEPSLFAQMGSIYSIPKFIVTAPINLDGPSLSRMSSTTSYMTAKSHLTGTSTVKRSSSSDRSTSAASLPQSEYYKLLRSKGLILATEKEIDWSGKGQHVEYSKDDTIPLMPKGTIGTSLTAVIEKVQCRRITLARKLMTCNRRFSLEDAMNEVEHLNRLRHAHIVQLVGTYVQGRSFAILLYPVADTNLKVFMRNVAIAPTNTKDSLNSRGVLMGSLGKFFRCIVNALEYIHRNTTRHMDIKPLNILVRAPYPHEASLFHRVYIADFGTSSSFVEDHSQTDGLRARTVKYCAPEVFNYEARGRASDIFSLGCVFAEMYTVLAGQDLDDFAQARAGTGSEDESFHSNLPRVYQWVDKLRGIPTPSSVLRLPIDFQLPLDLPGLIRRMLAESPQDRPTAAVLTESLPSRFCCIESPERYVAMGH